MKYFYIPNALYKSLLISKLFCTNTLQTAWVGGGRGSSMKYIYTLLTANSSHPLMGTNPLRTIGKGMGSENFDLMGPEIATHVHKNTNVPVF